MWYTVFALAYSVLKICWLGCLGAVSENITLIIHFIMISSYKLTGCFPLQVHNYRDN